MTSAKLRLRAPSFLPLLVSLAIAGCVGAALPPDAAAFSRGLASKVRDLRQAAYIERLQNARAAYDRGDYEGCAQEAQLALPHAADTASARPAHILLAAAYTQLGDAQAAQPHRDWLAQNQ